MHNYYLKDKNSVIKKIIKKHFSFFLEKILSDFNKNLSAKENNFLTSGFDSKVKAYLALTSSLESKLGNVMELCIRDLAKYRYGNKNVPNIINPKQIDTTGLKIPNNKQVIISEYDFKSKNFTGPIDSLLAENARDVKNSIDSSSTNFRNDEFNIDLSKINKKTSYKEVDLAFYNGVNWIICEIKAGGYLDNSNAKANIQKLAYLHVGLNVPNRTSYFATIYNKKGDVPYTGNETKHLNIKCFLIGEQFWNMILPYGISYKLFKGLYTTALKEIHFFEKLNKLTEV